MLQTVKFVDLYWLITNKVVSILIVLISTIYWMLYCKCDIQLRLIIEVSRMSSKRENSVCYILVFVLACSRAFWPIREPSVLFASPLTCSRALWPAREHRRAHHVTLLHKLPAGAYSRWRAPAQSSGLLPGPLFPGP